jgi:hypothetical protein
LEDGDPGFWVSWRPHQCPQSSTGLRWLISSVAYGAQQPDDPNLLLLYTARMRRFLDADADERAPDRSETIPAPGLKPSERIAEWLSDHLVAAVASDAVGVQALSPNSRIRTPPGAAPRSWGMQLGEFWVPEALARSCPRDSQYAFRARSRSTSGRTRLPARAVTIR